jgi:hypothetical protein
MLNDEEVKNKFSKISLDYFDCIFPLQFVLDEGYLVLKNEEAITRRIANKDQELSEDMEGEGFFYIREQFLEKTNTKTKLENFIASLGLISVLQLSLQRYNETSNIKLLWTIPILGATNWIIKKLDYPQDNSIVYIESTIDQAQVAASWQQYKNEQLKAQTNIEDVEFFATFKHEIKYQNKLLTIASSETNIILQLGTYFDYQETITLLSTIE